MMLVVSLKKMYKFGVKVHIEGNNYYEKNRITIQLMPENVDGFRHLPFLLLFVPAGWAIHGKLIIHSHVQCRSLTHRHCLYCSFPPIITTVCGLAC